MITQQFMQDFLKVKARITIVNELDEILYEGIVKNIPMEIINDTEIYYIDGLGLNNDIIIAITNKTEN